MTKAKSTDRLRRFHAAMVGVWAALIVPSILFWRESVLWVIFLSLWANLATHWGAWQSSRAETAATETNEGTT
ncbi:MAG TPA: hypothetical protein VMZ51_08110 [Acidimicrobiales bacterium]|nr:hypothetical protein [Acidimicrobiales bacterium]